MGLHFHTRGGRLTYLSAGGAAAAAPNGQVVMVRQDTATGTIGLQVSKDGRAWDPIQAPSACANPNRILAPRHAGSDPWIVAGIGICSSQDLATWTPTPLDVEFWGAAQTRYGALLLGDGCHGAGATCDPDPRAFLSVDGREWLALPPMPARAWSVADGPSGVVLLEADAAATGSLRAWLLTSRQLSSTASPS